MNVLAGWLPGAAQAVSAIAVAFNLYGILFMGFAAFGMAASTRVGNALGAGREAAARLAALASAIVAPLIWVAVAFLLTWPVSQNWLLGLFTTGADPLLLEVRKRCGVVCHHTGRCECMPGSRLQPACPRTAAYVLRLHPLLDPTTVHPLLGPSTGWPLCAAHAQPVVPGGAAGAV